MSELYIAALALHVTAAVVWIGGMLSFALLAPILRGLVEEPSRAGLFNALGRRFRTVGWVCVVTLVVTGVLQLRLRGWWGVSFWSRSALSETALGVALVLKLALAATMVGVQAVHDFWLGPKAGTAPVGSGEGYRLRVRAAWLARLNAFVALLLLYVAVRLGRGG